MDKPAGSIFYIGVDGGGTKTHAVLFNQKLEQIDEAYSGPANIATDIDGAYISICTVINSLLDQYNLPAQQIQIGIGVAGYSVTRNLEILRTKLGIKYANIIINSDCHIGCLAAHNNKDGTIIICGTGVVGYSIFNNDTRQLGGWGFPQGDLGGGAYLGLEAARTLCKVIDGIFPWNLTLKELYANFFQGDKHRYKMWLINAAPGDYAQIAKFVFSRPVDEFSNELLGRGVNEIAQLIFVLQKNMPNLAIKLAGGLAKLYIDRLQEIYSNIELSGAVPAYGAVLLALNHAASKS